MIFEYDLEESLENVIIINHFLTSANRLKELKSFLLFMEEKGIIFEHLSIDEQLFHYVDFLI